MSPVNAVQIWFTGNVSIDSFQPVTYGLDIEPGSGHGE